MVDDNKSKLWHAVAGVVVGAGAAIVGAVALSDKKNQAKVKVGIEKAKKLVKVVKTAEKGVKKI